MSVENNWALSHATQGERKEDGWDYRWTITNPEGEEVVSQVLGPNENPEDLRRLVYCASLLNGVDLAELEEFIMWACQLRHAVGDGTMMVYPGTGTLKKFDEYASKVNARRFSVRAFERLEKGWRNED